MELTQLELINKENILINGNFNQLGHSVVNNIENLFTFCDQFKYIDIINSNNNITSVITRPDFAEYFLNMNKGVIVSNDVRMDFFKIHNYLRLRTPQFQTTFGIGNNIDKSCIINNFNVTIGNNCTIEPNVVIHSNVEIGDGVIIRSGSIIGGQGFQFWKNSLDVLQIEHFGKTIIKNNVEVKELCTIHRALFNWDSTFIGENTKIDAHSHIGHSNKIGNKVYICSHSNISGNSMIEDDCYIGPGVNIPNRIKIGNKAKLSVGSTITNDIDNELIVSGNFAIPHHLYINHIKSLLK